ncbi:ABC transporter ATP-binding protein [Radiobacillus sp. PE A8.2]|uniref:ABC transporter ATP-binding protein n=1 Tax=Radiobacillus sp. PE A8.2 TaxID=3380349 RepID=UPI00388EF655
MTNILEVKNLKTYFQSDGEEIPAVDGVSFEIRKGETLGLVGESGSGKSITSLSILQLVPEPHGKIIDGEIKFNGKNLLDYNEKQIRQIRGNDISMIFQEPMTSLNPVFTVGDQIIEVLILHQKLDKKKARSRALELLDLVGIPLAIRRIDDYPHQLSGGMRQRIMIAMALACDPELLIADEPTTALDVTTQAQILELLKDLKAKFNMSMLLITHDLGVVADSADKVAVMYLGRIVEYTDVETFFEDPKHPYSQGLLKSIPSMVNSVSRLNPIKGQVPKPTDIKNGCRFCTRCEFVRDICIEEEPGFIDNGKQQVKCWMYSDRWDDSSAKEGKSSGTKAVGSKKS